MSKQAKRGTADVGVHSELACVYAALILVDDGLSVTEDKIVTILKAAGVTFEPFWPGLFAKALEGISVKDLITNVGSGMGSGGGGGAPAGGAAAAPAEEKKGQESGMGSGGGGGAPAGGAAPAEEKKEEEKKEESEEEESDDDMGFGLFD